MTTLKPVRNPSLAWRAIEREIMIISPEDSHVHELNETASFIWNLLDGERTTTEIAELMCKEYDVSPEIALAHTEETIDSLLKSDLLLISAVEKSGNHA
ncbi:MAG: PqqD family protein [Candidatus Acidiferrales bacterium]